MRKYIIIAALVLLLPTCLYLYIRNQSNHSNINITNPNEEPTQSTTSPTSYQASQEPTKELFQQPIKESIKESTKESTQEPTKELSQQPSPTASPPEQPTTVAPKEAVNCLTKEELEYNQKILEHLLELQELAKQFCKKSGVTKSGEFLMASFLRCGEERYVNKAWSKLAGDCEEFTEFLEKEDNNQAAFDLRETRFFYDPLTGEKIDFTHLMATLNVYLNQNLVYQVYPEVGDIGGWAGDCIQLAVEAKKAQVAEQELKKFMNGRLGVTGQFGIGDILADLDALNLYEELQEGADLPSVWEAYYSSLGKNTRYKKFVNYRFPDVNSEEQLTQEILSIVAPEYSLAIFQVYQQEGLNKEETMFSRVAGECFAEYLWKLQ